MRGGVRGQRPPKDHTSPPMNQTLALRLRDHAKCNHPNALVRAYLAWTRILGSEPKKACRIDFKSVFRKSNNNGLSRYARVLTNNLISLVAASHARYCRHREKVAQIDE